jgi:hypothetical protein
MVAPTSDKFQTRAPVQSVVPRNHPAADERFQHGDEPGAGDRIGDIGVARWDSPRRLLAPIRRKWGYVGSAPFLHAGRSLAFDVPVTQGVPRGTGARSEVDVAARSCVKRSPAA